MSEDYSSMGVYDSYALHSSGRGGHEGYKKIEFIHDLAKNLLIGASVYCIADSQTAGLAAAGALSTLDTILFCCDAEKRGYHLIKDIAAGIMVPIAIFNYFDIKGFHTHSKEFASQENATLDLAVSNIAGFIISPFARFMAYLTDDDNELKKEDEEFLKQNENK